MTSLIAMILSLCLTAGNLWPDTITLKDGTVLSNVKTDIRSLFVAVDFEDGKHLEISKAEIRSVKMSSVSWGAKSEEDTRVVEASVQGDAWQPRPEEEQISPLGNFFVGLVPGMSGLYRTENYVGGATFSVLSIASMVWLNKATANGKKQEFRSQRENKKAAEPGYAAVTLGLVTLTNAFASAISASRWNQGIWSGDPLQAPTTPGGRALRSAIVPGWGQIHGGNYGKGTGFLAIGLACLGAAGSENWRMQASRIDGRVSRSQALPLLLAGALSQQMLFSNFGLARHVRYVEAQRRAVSLKNSRDAYAGAFGTVWLLSIVDAAFFSGADAQKVSLSVAPDTVASSIRGRERLALNYNFAFTQTF